MYHWYVRINFLRFLYILYLPNYTSVMSFVITLVLDRNSIVLFSAHMSIELIHFDIVSRCGVPIGGSFTFHIAIYILNFVSIGIFHSLSFGNYVLSIFGNTYENHWNHLLISWYMYRESFHSLSYLCRMWGYHRQYFWNILVMSSCLLVNKLSIKVADWCWIIVFRFSALSLEHYGAVCVLHVY